MFKDPEDRGFYKIHISLVALFFVTLFLLTFSNVTQGVSKVDALTAPNIVAQERSFYVGELSDNKKIQIDGFLVATQKDNSGKNVWTSDELKKLTLDDDSKLFQEKLIQENSSNLDLALWKSTAEVETIYDDSDLAQIQKVEGVEFVEPNFICDLHYIPNDPALSNQWWIKDTLDSDVDIQAYEMWDLESAALPDTVVGVIDTGVYLDHEDLAGNLVAGYDFDRDQVAAYDYYGHGTHVAGIIAAVANNGIGGTGVSGRNNLKVMPLRIDLSVFEIIEAIEYAGEHDVRVVNLSLGGTGYSQSLKNAIDNFDGLVIASAGNWGGDNDGYYPIYPASYESKNIVAVAAVDSNNNVASWSNYGATSVDVAAPGVTIYSTYPDFVSESDEDFHCTDGETLTDSDYENDSSNPVGQEWTVHHDGETCAAGYMLEDDYAMAGDGVYGNDQDHSMILSTPIDASGSVESPNLEISFSAVIEYTVGCTADYLSVSVDDNDDNWTELVRYCGSFDDVSTSEPDWFTYNIDLEETYSNMRVKVRWVTNSSVTGSRAPVIKSLVLRSQSDVDSSYAYMSGTSMAAPVVSGLAGLIFAENPDIGLSYAKYLLTTTGDDYLNASSWPTATGKSVNGENMMRDLQNPADGSFKQETWFDSSSWELSDYYYPFKASGDFDGDGIDELVAMKKLSSTSMELWVYPTHGNGTITGEKWSSFDPWYVNNTLYMDAGDFNNDGKDDLFTFYKYNDTTFAAWVFISDGESFTPQRWMVFNPWYIDHTEFISIGDYNNDNLMDIGVFYKYSDTVIALWVFESNGSEFVPDRWYVFDPWYINSTKFVSSGDYNGDGLDDMAAFYTYNSETVAMWVFESNGSRMTPKRWQVFNPWYVNSTKLMTTGDFNNDNRDDLGFYYTYGEDRMALWVYQSDGTKFNPSRWNVFDGLVNANVTDWIGGDYLGSGVDAVLSVFDNGYGHTEVKMYR